MKKRILGIFKHALRVVAYGAVGVVLTLLVVMVTYLNGRPDLSVWHTVFLDEEFKADSAIDTFSEYLELEDRLFRQLDTEVYAKVPASAGNRINRFSKGSLSDPGQWPQNWNRTYEMPAATTADTPRAVVLLLHGLSDSPYSLRHLAQSLNDQGAHVLGLRIPGHGTVPSALVRTDWRDMAAAVKLAVRHLSGQHPGIPLHIVGYSNGAALALIYALESLSDDELPRVDRMVLISPEIGVTKLAAFAKTQSRLGRLLGLEKLAWNDIFPEYDPYKYGSFAVNAGRISYEITTEIQRRMTGLEESGKLQDLPPILAFSSVVDATVQVMSLVEQLFYRLPAGGHELVLFDINRISGIDQLMLWDPSALVAALSEHPKQRYALKVLTNQDSENQYVQLKSWPPGSADPSLQELPYSWPEDVYSLTHVALPFPPTDSLYGGHPDGGSPGIHLGEIVLRGERGVLQVSAADMLRQRWNPFYPFLEQHSLEFLGLTEELH